VPQYLLSFGIVNSCYDIDAEFKAIWEDISKLKPKLIERDAESYLSLENDLRREQQRFNSCYNIFISQ